jgi:hypothetical protein
MHTNRCTWIIYLLAALIAVQAVMAKNNNTLSHHEKVFKHTLAYRLKDFSLQWPIDAFAVYRYDLLGTEHTVRYKDLKPVFRGGAMPATQKVQNDIEALANMMFKREEQYFLYKPHGIRVIFHLVVFRKNGKTYALESFEELKKMLGTLDTPAKLLLWLRLKNLANPASYLYTHGAWRVRFVYRTHCSRGEYFEFYNTSGTFVRHKKIKSYRKKNCQEIIAD